MSNKILKLYTFPANIPVKFFAEFHDIPSPSGIMDKKTIPVFWPKILKNKSRNKFLLHVGSQFPKCQKQNQETKNTIIKKLGTVRQSSVANILNSAAFFPKYTKTVTKTAQCCV